MKWFIILFLLLTSCADLKMDVYLPDVYIGLGTDGGVVDGGEIDIRISDIDIRGNSIDGVVYSEEQIGNEEKYVFAPSLPTMPLRTR